MERIALRDRWRRGEVDKAEYASEMRTLHRTLEEYAELIADTRIDSITISEGQVVFASSWAPVSFHANIDDVGTPVSVALTFGDYEPHEMELLSDLLAGAEVFVDVGANIGWYALHASALRPSLTVVALEPVSATYEELRRNIELNRSPVLALKLALSDAPGSGEMQVPVGIAGASSFHLSRPYPGQRVEMVEVSTLDTLASQHHLKIDVVKVDVEGAELQVLRGGNVTLARDRPAVIAEMLRIHSAPFGYHPNEIIDYMITLGYRCFAATKIGWRPFARMDESTVETNFAFLHDVRHGDRIRQMSGD